MKQTIVRLFYRIVHFILTLEKLFLIMIYKFFMKDKSWMYVMRKKIENFLFFAPRRKKLYKIQKELLGKIEPVRFLTDDNVKLYAWLIKADIAKPVVIFCHGQSESISKWQNTAIFLNENNFNAFFISYRGHYNSASTPSEDGLYKDVLASIDYLESIGYKKEDMIIWGRSLGAACAVNAGMELSMLRGIILESAFDNIKNAGLSVAYHNLKEFNLLFLFHIFKNIFEKIEFVQKFDNVAKLPDVKPPILIIHSKTDEKIHCASALALKKSNRKAKLVLAKEGSHDSNDWCFDDVKEFIEDL